MANDVNINPRYLSYNKDEVQALLDKVNATTVASETSVREIVTNYEGGDSSDSGNSEGDDSSDSGNSEGGDSSSSEGDSSQDGNDDGGEIIMPPVDPEPDPDEEY